jgi:agmatinase
VSDAGPAHHLDALKPRDGFRSPRFGQPATFMRLPYLREARGLDVAIVGVPYDGGTSYRPGARFGPRHIRDQSSLIRPFNPVLEVSPFEQLRIADYGDVDVSPVSLEETFAAIERELDVVVGAGAIPLAVGGDHSITLPVLRSLARRHGPLALVHFDSHPDTWGEYAGSYHYHGSTFRRAIEEGLVDGRRLIQIGIRGPIYSRDDFEFHAEHGLEAIRIGEVKDHGVASIVERLARLEGRPAYCSFDIDAVDPAYAPATGTPEVGGLTAYEALALVRGLRRLDLVGADLVEVAPPYDGPGAITSVLAANLLFELLCLFALQRSR